MHRTSPTLTLVLTLAVLALGGCKKQPPVEDVVDTPALAAASAEAPSTMPEAIATMKKHFQRVHFEFDASTLDAESKEALAANVAIMQAYPSIVVEVQGHADERGTTEYNLGLGDRRAAAVHTAMTSMGVSASRVTTVSYGEERPLAEGSGEVTWSQNRRAEFRILVDEGATLVEGTTR